MSLEDFQLSDNESFENSIIKREFLKTYHQQGAQINFLDQNVGFIFAESNNYHHFGNSYLELDITVQDPTAGVDTNAEIRLVNNAFAYCFKEGLIWTMGGMYIELVKVLGQVSTIVRASISKEGDLLSHFDKSNEGDTNASGIGSSLKQMLTYNHSVPVYKGKIKGLLPLEHISFNIQNKRFAKHYFHNNH